MFRFRIAIAGIPVDALSKTATATICGQVCTQVRHTLLSFLAILLLLKSLELCYKVSAIFVLLQYDMRRILGRTNGDGSQKVRK
ncbi:hypothetical protein Plhal703r1_c19g0088011 [Plasmopara halstedii]